MKNLDQLKDEIWNIIQTFSNSWLNEKDIDKIASLLHSDFIAITPTNEKRQNKDQVIKSFQEYINYGKTISFQESDPKIQIYNNGLTAVVSYYYILKTEFGGNIIKIEGRDMYTLVSEDTKWTIVAQHYSVKPNA